MTCLGLADDAGNVLHLPALAQGASPQTIDVETLRFASMDTLLDVASRDGLTSDLTAILVFRGNAEVIAAVTANPIASFARSSLTTLVELAPSDRRLKDNLVCRTDLPEALGMRMLPFLNPAQMVSMFVAGASIDTQSAATDLAAEREVFQGSGVDPSRDINATVVALCQDARVSEISEVVAERLRVPLASVMNLLCGRMDHAAGLTLLAAGMAVGSVQPLLDLRQRLACRESRDGRAAFDVFTRYTVADAKSLVRDCSRRLQESGLVMPEFDRGA